MLTAALILGGLAAWTIVGLFIAIILAHIIKPGSWADKGIGLVIIALPLGPGVWAMFLWSCHEERKDKASRKPAKKPPTAPCKCVGHEETCGLWGPIGDNTKGRRPYDCAWADNGECSHIKGTT